MMPGIRHVASWLPEGRIDNRERVDQFGVDESFIARRTGMMSLAIKPAEMETSDLCVEAFRALCEESGLEPGQLECLVVCTQNPDAYGLPHTSAIVHGKLELEPYCACFDVGLGCSGYLYGLTILQGFMMAAGLKNGVLITADPYSKIIDPDDRNTSLIFGDGATATWMSTEEPVRWRLGKGVFGTDGNNGPAIRTREEDRRFEMAGRAVVEFCAKVIPENIHQTLERNDISLDQVDRVLAHQGSRYIVELISRKMGLTADRVPFACADYGNTVSSSVPMLLARETSARCVLLTGFGVGLSWGSLVLYRY